MKPSSARYAKTSSAGLSSVRARARNQRYRRFLLAPSSLPFILHQTRPSLLHHGLLHPRKASVPHRPNLLHSPKLLYPLPPGCARSRSCAIVRPTFVYAPMERKKIGMRDSTIRGRSLLLSVNTRPPAMLRLAGRSISCENPPERCGMSYADRLPLAIAPSNQPSSRPPRKFNGSSGSPRNAGTIPHFPLRGLRLISGLGSPIDAQEPRTSRKNGEGCVPCPRIATGAPRAVPCNVLGRPRSWHYEPPTRGPCRR